MSEQEAALAQKREQYRRRKRAEWFTDFAHDQAMRCLVEDNEPGMRFWNEIARGARRDEQEVK